MAVKVSNNAIVHDALNELRDALAGYIGQELNTKYGQSWWSQAVLKNLSPVAKSSLPQYGPYSKLIDSLDIAACLSLLTGPLWNEVFKKKLSITANSWAHELHAYRVQSAHMGAEGFKDTEVPRVLDTAARLADLIDSETADVLRERLREFQYGTSEASHSAPPMTAPDTGSEAPKTPLNSIALPAVPSVGLKSWRTIMQPHPDVADGRYTSAEFAADLAQVASGTADNEYQDSVEFFSRTYLTEGIKGLLTAALKRISGQGGEPVIQLKTAFGGGKTHSLLAIYHLFRESSKKDSLPAIREIKEAAGLAPDTKLSANVVTVVGTRLNPSKTKRPADLPGVTVNTVWGEIAYQLAKQTGDHNLYRLVKEADRKGVSPGADALQELLDKAGPTVILLDELVAYAKKLYGAKDLPAGTHDNFITFIQEITEAAKSSKNGLVVASIPESEFEIGGEAGETALRQIEHTMGRTEAVWKPVAADEGFEVVRRRLFGECMDPEGRDAVCSAFARMYEDQKDEFPVDAHMPDYKQRLLASYPIHPEMFDRLYDDWSTLESFQRTRGVLRLMAATIHELWMNNDQGLLIMPGSLPLSRPNVREELARYIPPEWNSVLDREVDGQKSTPYKLERDKPHLAGNMAARRVARTMMLGSAPSERGRSLRGISRKQIRLGAVQPGESLSTFNDALETLRQNLSYLYAEPSTDTYWYDTRPTLRKTASDKAQAVSADKAEEEIVRRLSKEKAPKGFLAGVHAAPLSTLEVSDDKASRLVILPPDKAYNSVDSGNAAVLYAREILDKRGSSPRVNRNMLVFAAPDSSAVSSAITAAKWYLAWNSILEDKERLNLDAAQVHETKEQVKEAEARLMERVRSAYSWLLVPTQDTDSQPQTVSWTAERMPGSGQTIADKAVTALDKAFELSTVYGAHTLNKQLESLLWNGTDHLSIEQLWNYYAQYLYLDRLPDENVLREAVRRGVNSGLFAYADSFDGTQYAGLNTDGVGLSILPGGLVVRRGAAEAQLKRAAVLPANPPKKEEPHESPSGKAGQPAQDRKRGFVLTVPMHPETFTLTAEQVKDYIIDVLNQQPGCSMKIRLDIEASNPDGFTKNIQRAINENIESIDNDFMEFTE